MSTKILIEKKNAYEFPGSPRPGSWGQILVFADGSSEFDPDHSQNAAIEAASRAVFSESKRNSTFARGAVGRTPEGVWVPTKTEDEFWRDWFAAPAA